MKRSGLVAGTTKITILMCTFFCVMCAQSRSLTTYSFPHIYTHPISFVSYTVHTISHFCFRLWNKKYMTRRATFNISFVNSCHIAWIQASLPSLFLGLLLHSVLLSLTIYLGVLECFGHRHRRRSVESKHNSIIIIIGLMLHYYVFVGGERGQEGN